MAHASRSVLAERSPYAPSFDSVVASIVSEKAAEELGRAFIAHGARLLLISSASDCVGMEAAKQKFQALSIDELQVSVEVKSTPAASSLVSVTMRLVSRVLEKSDGGAPTRGEVPCCDLKTVLEQMALVSEAGDSVGQEWKDAGADAVECVEPSEHIVWLRNKLKSYNPQTDGPKSMFRRQVAIEAQFQFPAVSKTGTRLDPDYDPSKFTQPEDWMSVAHRFVPSNFSEI